MRKNKKIYLIAFLLTFITCKDRKDQGSVPSSPYEQAKQYLANGDYSNAYTLFNQLIEKEGEKPEYLLGIALTNLASELAKLPEKIRDSFSLFGSPKLKEKLKEIESKQVGGLNTVLEGFIRKIMLDAIELNLPILYKVASKIDENFMFDITAVTVKFPNSTFAFLGAYGDVEVFYLISILEYLRFLLRFILSINVNAPVM